MASHTTSGREGSSLLGCPFACRSATLGLAFSLPASAQLVTDGQHLLPQTDLDSVIEAGDRFGSALASGDVDGHGVDDLATGAPEAVWSGVSFAGVAQEVHAWPPGWISGDEFESGRLTK